MHKLQHCLGERGKGGKSKADRVNCPKDFVLHCSYLTGTYAGGQYLAGVYLRDFKRQI